MTMRPVIAVATLAWALAAPAQTPTAVDTDTPLAQTRRPDEHRPEAPVTTTVLGRTTELGLSYEISHERRLNFDLDRGTQRDRDVLDHELKVDARWGIGQTGTAFVQGVVLAERRELRRDSSVRLTHSFERGQTWLLVEGLAGAPLSLQIGRVALIEPRSWWWDEDLDAVRLNLVSGPWRLQTGLARELARVSSAQEGIEPEQKGVTRWFGDASVRWAPQHTLALLWLLADDRSGVPTVGALFEPDTEDRSDARLRWVGLRAGGEVRAGRQRLSYRADAAVLRGRVLRTPFTETSAGQLSAGASVEREVRARAWDVGLQWRLPGHARPTFSVGLASGSGGRDAERVDQNFQQTGLQENKARVGGVKRVRTYGELLDPELSNLQVATLGFGLRLLPRSSIELLAHAYRQQVASTRIAGARLSLSPLGLERDIGRELDLVLALRESRHIELFLKLARFTPGKAFAANRRDAAQSAEVGITLTF